MSRTQVYARLQLDWNIGLINELFERTLLKYTYIE
jgi:hypothetical protein